MVLLAVTDVIGYKLFSHGIPGASDLIEEFNVILVSMAIAYVQLERGHIRITVLEKFMSAGLSYGMRLAGYIIGILVCGLLSWRALILLQNMIENAVRKVGAIYFPLWPFSLALFLGFSFLTIAFIISLSRVITAKARA
jgi:TRAP-type C4-dicarboxylate transport system permease small subunit